MKPETRENADSGDLSLDGQVRSVVTTTVLPLARAFARSDIVMLTSTYTDAWSTFFREDTNARKGVSQITSSKDDTSLTMRADTTDEGEIIYGAAPSSPPCPPHFYPNKSFSVAPEFFLQSSTSRKYGSISNGAKASGSALGNVLQTTDSDECDYRESPVALDAHQACCRPSLGFVPLQDWGSDQHPPLCTWVS